MLTIKLGRSKDSNGNYLNDNNSITRNSITGYSIQGSIKGSNRNSIHSTYSKQNSVHSVHSVYSKQNSVNGLNSLHGGYSNRNSFVCDDNQGTNANGTSMNYGTNTNATVASRVNNTKAIKKKNTFLLLFYFTQFAGVLMIGICLWWTLSYLGKHQKNVLMII